MSLAEARNFSRDVAPDSPTAHIDWKGWGIRYDKKEHKKWERKAAELVKKSTQRPDIFQTSLQADDPVGQAHIVELLTFAAPEVATDSLASLLSFYFNGGLASAQNQDKVQAKKHEFVSALGHSTIDSAVYKGALDSFFREIEGKKTFVEEVSQDKDFFIRLLAQMGHGARSCIPIRELMQQHRPVAKIVLDHFNSDLIIGSKPL